MSDPDAAQAALDRAFWDDAAALYHVTRPPRVIRPDDPFHYWWQAHALDALLDAHGRDPRGGHVGRAQRLVAGVRRANHGSLHNAYYDDMLWMALALLRLHAAGDESALADCRALWTDVQGGWNDHQGGGVAWRRSQADYKNTPANGPAVILGARLYRHSGDVHDLDFARAVWTWLCATLVDPVSGVVWDGVNRVGDGRTDVDWAFTYNEGTVIGAGVELWRATSDRGYLDVARRTARAALQRYGPRWPDEGGGDAALFKGILARYLALLAHADPGSAPDVADVLSRSAADVSGHVSADGLAGPDWTSTPQGEVELSAALSGVMLLSAAAVQVAAAHTGS